MAISVERQRANIMKAVEDGQLTQQEAMEMLVKLEPPEQFQAEGERQGKAGRIAQAVKPAVVTAGAMAGSAPGIATANPAAAVGGGALGAAGAEFGFEAVLDLLRRAGVKGLPDPTSMPERIKNAMFESGLEVGTGAAFPAGRAGMELLKRGARRALAVGDEGLEIAEKARLAGIELTPVDMTRSSFVSKFPKVVGRMPFLARPFRGKIDKQLKEIGVARERLALRLGPSMNIIDAGVHLNRSMDASFRLFRMQMNKEYGEILSDAVATDTKVKTGFIKELAEGSVRTLNEKNPFLKQDDADPFEVADQSNPAVAYLTRIVRELPDEISIQKYDGLMAKWDEAVNKAKNDSFNLMGLTEFKRGVEQKAADNMTNPEIGQRFKTQDQKYAKIMREVFETPTAQKANLVKKDRFKVGLSRPGAYNADETLDLVVNMNSAEAMGDLLKLVGKKRFKSTLSSVLDDKMTRAFRDAEAKLSGAAPVGGIKQGVEEMRDYFGLANKKGARYVTMQKAFAQAGVDFTRVEGLLDASKIVLDQLPPEVAVFLARRMTLAGARGLVSGALPVIQGVKGFGAKAGATGVFLMSYYFGKVMTNPKLMQLVDASLDHTRSDTVRRGAAASAIRLLELELQDEPGARPGELERPDEQRTIPQ